MWSIFTPALTVVTASCQTASERFDIQTVETLLPERSPIEAIVLATRWVSDVAVLFMECICTTTSS
jgi:hypothetical protein